MKDILNIADIVLRKFKNDKPNITKCFVKFDNAGCCHGNVPETLLMFAKRMELTYCSMTLMNLKRGKDQCDRESATLKSLVSSYINAGSDIITAEDVFATLHYGNFLKHSQVCVAEISEEDTILQEKGIKKFSDIHSVSFKKDHMVLYQYYDIGSGIIEPYGNVNFIPAITEVKPFSACSQNMDFIPSANWIWPAI